jgi:hypothetical protein
MSSQSIWYAEQVNLEALFIGNPVLELSLKPEKKSSKKELHIFARGSF